MRDEHFFKRTDPETGDVVSVETNTHGEASPGFEPADSEEVEQFRASLPEREQKAHQNFEDRVDERLRDHGLI